jgi:hypothetical protein
MEPTEKLSNGLTAIASVAIGFRESQGEEQPEDRFRP